MTYFLKSRVVSLHILHSHFESTVAITCWPQFQWSDIEGLGKSATSEPQQNKTKHDKCALIMDLLPDTENFGLRIRRECQERFLRQQL